MTLIRLVRLFGLRDGLRLWQTRATLRSDARLARPTFDIHHGRHPDMPGYRRARRHIP